MAGSPRKVKESQKLDRYTNKYFERFDKIRYQFWIEKINSIPASSLAVGLLQQMQTTSQC